MTTPTGPDDDRLRAAIARLETCSYHDRGIACAYGHCPAPQQPPAQEREYRSASGVISESMAEVKARIAADEEQLAQAAAIMADQPTPPSEADSACEEDVDISDIVFTPKQPDRTGRIVWDDSAGEDKVERAARAYYIAWNNDEREWAAKAWDDMGGSEPSQERAEIVLAMTEALAASSGVRGGDDQARERLARWLWEHDGMKAEQWTQARETTRDDWRREADLALHALRADQ